MTSVQRDLADTRFPELSRLGAFQRCPNSPGFARIAHPPDRQMRRPRPLGAIESRLHRDHFDLRRQLNQPLALQSRPEDSGSAQIRKSSDAAGKHMQGRFIANGTVQRLFQRWKPRGIDCRSQEFQRDMQILAPRPCDAVVGQADLVDKARKRGLDFIADPHRDESANLCRERYLSSSHSTSGNRSLPKNITPSTKIDGDPKPPRSINSSVFARSFAL